MQERTSTTSAEIPDWSRELPRRFWDPSRRLLASIRGYQRSAGRGPIRRLKRTYWIAQHWFWSIICQAEIDLSSEIGGGLLLPHPNGIVVHPKVRIGPNCLIFQQVTIGTGGKDGVPVIAGHVDIGAGAKLLGPISIGAHAVIGANAVVVRDVPQGMIVGGIPARELH